MHAVTKQTGETPGRGSELSDEEVVGRIRGGETPLFELLMRRHNQRLYRVARSILRDEAEAEDVVQEAYISAFTHLDQFLGTARFSTWLTRIAVHEALRLSKRQSRSTPLDDVVDTLEAPGAGPDKTAFHHELRKVLESSVDRVPEQFRTVFVLRDVEGLSTADTAACLSIPEETVKTRLHRARQHLRRQLDAALGASAHEAFSFGFARCDRIVRAVLERISC